MTGNTNKGARPREAGAELRTVLVAARAGIAARIPVRDMLKRANEARYTSYAHDRDTASAKGRVRVAEAPVIDY
jgi:hypothetical protein